MDYLKFYELETEPFHNGVDPRFYYVSEEHEQARMRLLRGIRHHKGLAVLWGKPGCGKTTLASRMVHELEAPAFAARLCIVPHVACARGWLLPQIAHCYGAPPAHDPAHLIQGIHHALLAIHSSGGYPVLFVDEAQMLASVDVMQEFRGLLNLVHHGGPLLSIVLCGLPELGRVLQLDAPLAQRVEIRVELTGMGAEESARYLAHRLECAGGSPALFSDAAREALCQYAGGVPRVLNTLADNALFEGFLARARPVGVEAVVAAADALGLGHQAEPAAAAPEPEMPAPAPVAPARPQPVAAAPAPRPQPAAAPAPRPTPTPVAAAPRPQPAPVAPPPPPQPAAAPRPAPQPVAAPRPAPAPVPQPAAPAPRPVAPAPEPGPVPIAAVRLVPQAAAAPRPPAPPAPAAAPVAPAARPAAVAATAVPFAPTQNYEETLVAGAVNAENPWEEFSMDAVLHAVDEPPSFDLPVVEEAEISFEDDMDGATAQVEPPLAVAVAVAPAAAPAPQAPEAPASAGDSGELDLEAFIDFGDDDEIAGASGSSLPVMEAVPAFEEEEEPNTPDEFDSLFDSIQVDD
jgi:general secretion pathway protein A